MRVGTDRDALQTSMFVTSPRATLRRAVIVCIVYCVLLCYGMLCYVML